MQTKEIFDIIYKSFNENNNSHAFLFVTNNINESDKDVYKLIKKINCKDGGKEDCTCNICHTIDVKTNPDVIEINPTNKEINVDSINYLLSAFATKPIINDHQIYIINEAEKLNNSAANKILKFLEEAENGIVGIFITTNLDAIIPTIKSRCEIYNLHYGLENVLDLLNLTKDDYDKYYDITTYFINKMNNIPKYELLANTKELSSKDRLDIEKIIKLMQKIYSIKFEDIISNTYSNISYAKQVLDLINTNDIEVLSKRLNALNTIIDDMKYNVNKDLIIYKFFLLWE